MKRLYLPLLVLLVLAAAAAAQDTLQIAKEQLSMRSYAEAARTLNAAIKVDARNWRAHYMLGQCFLTGFQQPDNAIKEWLIAWGYAKGRARGGVEAEDFRQLGEDLTTVLIDRVKAAGEAGPKLLETTLVNDGFVSMPLVKPMLERFAKLQKWNAIKKVLELINKQSSEDIYRRNESELAQLDYYEGRALAALNDPMGAYQKLSLAQRKGVPGAEPELARLSGVLETTALAGLAEADRAYQAKEYAKAKGLYQALVAKLPEGLHTRDTAAKRLENADIAARVDFAMREFEAAKAKKDFIRAEAVLKAAVSQESSDEAVRATQEQLKGELAALKAQVVAQVESAEKADQEVTIKRAQLITDAQQLKHKGLYREAGAKLEEAQKLKKTDDVTALLAELAKSYEVEESFSTGQASYRKRDWAGAVSNLTKVVEGDATYHDREVQKMLALSYFELHQFDKGRDTADRILSHSEDPELLRKMADVTEGTRDSRVEMARAIGYLERLQKVDGDPAIATRISELNWELNKPKYYALGLMILIWVGGYIFVKKKPDWSKKINLNDLERFVNKKMWNDAAALHPSLLKMQLSAEEETTARHLFARAFFESGNYSKAISECQHVLRVFPDNKQLKVLLARCLYATKNISPENLQYFLELMETDPQNKDLITFVGQFALKKRLVTPMTLPILRTLAQLSPDDDGLRGLLIKGYIKDNDRTPAAMALYDIERKKNPKNIDVRVILAEDYLRKGEVTRAIQECEEIINIELNHPRTHDILARAYSKLGKLDELKALYQSLLEADPHNGAIVNFLGKLTSGEPLDRSGTLDRPPLDRSGTVDRPVPDRSGSLSRDAMPVPEAPAEVAPETTSPEPGPSSAPTPPPPSEEAQNASGRTARPAAGRIQPRTAERKGAPASIQRQMELLNQSGMTDQAALAAAAKEAAPPPNPPSTSSRHPLCRKCGKEVPPGTYFCACGQAL